MEQKLISNNLLKRGFTLIEVIVSLLIVSITFITFSGLLDQNLKSQDIKRLKTLQNHTITREFWIMSHLTWIEGSQ